MRFFTSDTHFGHKNVIPYCERPWATVGDMTIGLVERWNSVVRPGDQVYVLGDFSFYGSTKTAEILTSLAGEKILVRGNHDDVKSEEKAMRLGFSEYKPNHGWITIGDRNAWLSHYPFLGEGDSTEVERYAARRIVYDGNWLLHGHVHREWRTKNRMINVGVDVWGYRPVSEAAIVDLMNKEVLDKNEKLWFL